MGEIPDRGKTPLSRSVPSGELGRGRGGHPFLFSVSFHQTLARLDRDSGGGELLPYKRLMGMCCKVGSHFHDWIDYNGVVFSIKLLERGRTFSDFWGKTVLHIYCWQTHQNVCAVGEKYSVLHSI